MTNIDLTNSRIALNLNGASLGAIQNGPLHGFASRVGAFLRRAADRWSYAQRCRALNILSDDQLSQLGIRRQDIPRYVMLGKGNNGTY